MQEVVNRLLVAGIALAALPAAAVTLGEARVASALGEPLDIRIPVSTAPGESIEGACFSLTREALLDAPRLATARLALERSSQGTALRVRSTAPIEEPAFAFAIRVACPGQGGESRREYSVLLDPRPAAAQARATAAAAPAAAPPAQVAPSPIANAVATLIARIGDTLESIAHAIFPRNRAAKKAYIAALRDTNAPLASLGDNDPIPVDTPIALPDLRTFARAHPLRETQVASAPRERAAPAKRAREESRRVAAAEEPKRVAAPRAPAPRREAAPAREAPAPTAAAPAPARGDSRFVLRLSGSQVDLTPSRGVDDRKRAQLRQRLMLLDNDDQVAALLSLQNSVRQLESRVAELQLKLAGMPPSLAARDDTAKAEAARAEAARAEAARAEAARAEAARAEAARAEAARAEAAKDEAARAEAARLEAARLEAAKAEAAKAEAAKAEVAKDQPTQTEPAQPPAPQAEPRKPKAVPVTAAAESGWLSDSLWLLAGFGVVLALLLAWRLARRRRAEQVEDEIDDEDAVPQVDEEAPIIVADERKEPSFAAEPARASVASDAALPTRISFGDTDALRRRYIEERFPEVAAGAIRLEEPDSVIKAARLFYEDGAIARAVELLHFAIDMNPDEVRLWLALFEVFRLERLTGEYAELARRFKERHGARDAWRKVQYFGREIDPGNPLYADESFKNLETIGPAAARRMAADDFDPLAENWLNAPMDFQNDVLANDLRTAMMSDARMRDQDLVPNPMPALRNVEIFSVA